MEERMVRNLTRAKDNFEQRASREKNVDKINEKKRNLKTK